jgi:hypothetical protein
VTNEWRSSQKGGELPSAEGQERVGQRASKPKREHAVSARSGRPILSSVHSWQPNPAIVGQAMAGFIGPGQALAEKPGVQIIEVLESQPGRAEALANEADLVLDLSLLPPRGRRAGGRVDAASCRSPA